MVNPVFSFMMIRKYKKYSDVPYGLKCNGLKSNTFCIRVPKGVKNPHNPTYDGEIYKGTLN